MSAPIYRYRINGSLTVTCFQKSVSNLTYTRDKGSLLVNLQNQLGAFPGGGSFALPVTNKFWRGC